MFAASGLCAFVPQIHETKLLKYDKMNKSMSMYNVAVASQHGRHSGHNIHATTCSPGLLQHLILPHSCIVLNQLLRTPQLQSEVDLGQSLS